MKTTFKKSVLAVAAISALASTGAMAVDGFYIYDSPEIDFAMRRIDTDTGISIVVNNAPARQFSDITAALNWAEDFSSPAYKYLSSIQQKFDSNTTYTSGPISISGINHTVTVSPSSNITYLQVVRPNLQYVEGTQIVNVESAPGSQPGQIGNAAGTVYKANIVYQGQTYVSYETYAAAVAASGGYYNNNSGMIRDAGQASEWRFNNTQRASTYVYRGVTVQNVRVYTSPNNGVSYVGKEMVDGQARYATLTVEELKKITDAIDKELDAEAPKAQQKKERKPNAAVAGAIAINILAEEFINPHLKEEGVSVGATVGGSADLPETAIGISKNLGDGWSANLGVTTDTGSVSVGVNKSVEVSDNVRVGAGVGYSEAGWNVGPSLQLHDGEGNGVGVTGFGVIPTITVQGYTVAVVPQLFIPNMIVVGAQIAYKWFRAE